MTDSPIYCGCLKRKRNGIGMWRHFKCELYPGKIVFKHNSTGDIKEILELNNQTAIISSSDDSHKFTLKNKEETVQFAADSQKSLENWVIGLKSITLNDRTYSMKEFRIIKKVGSGYFSKVYLVEHRSTKKKYALKSIHKSFLISENKVESAIAEKDILVRTQHPFVVGMKFSFQNEKKIYFGLEYVPGGDLFKLIESPKTLPLEHIRFYLCEIMLALKYLHSIGVIYRDLKGENVLMGKDGHIKLSDFGLSKLLKKDNNDDTTKTFCGTTEYLAPEMIELKKYDYSIDWWALGILAYELTYKVTPFYDQKTRKVYDKILHSEPKFAPNANPDFVGFVKSCLTKNPAQRPGFEQLKNHPFFKGVKWDDFLAKKVTPPRKPKIAKISLKARKRRHTESDATYIPHNPAFDGFSYTGEA